MTQSDIDIIDQIIIYTALPLTLVFAFERFFIYLVATNPKVKTWAKRQFWLHPNFISRSRYPMGLISILIYHFINPVFAIFWFGLWIISDLTDGSLARYLNNKTEIGEIIDPFSDKLLYFPPLLYSCFYLNILNANLVLIFLAVDTFGQLSRFFSATVSANLFGKAKTLFCVVTLTIVYVQECYFHNQLFAMGDFTLTVTIVLAVCSVFFRLIPNYWYANILSILNLLCGLTSIVLMIFFNLSLVYAFLLIFFGQILDLFDGRAAEKWGSTPRGEIFDDLADGTSFGIAISTMIYFAIEPKALSLITAIFYGSCTIYRLVRFLKDKKAAGSDGGVNTFNGLPSPAGALFAGTYVILTNSYCTIKSCNSYLTILPIIFIALLMISHQPYIHAGRVVISKIPKLILVAIYSGLLLAVTFSIKLKSFELLIMLLFILAVSYLILGHRKLFNKISP